VRPRPPSPARTCCGRTATCPRTSRRASTHASGLLLAEQRGEWIELDFPAKAAPPWKRRRAWLPRSGVKAANVAKNQFDYLVEVASEEEVRAAAPDFTALKKVGARGIIVTAPRLHHWLRFRLAFFAPGSGIDEDPVTGSSHTAPGTYWAGRRMGKPSSPPTRLPAAGGIVRVRVKRHRVIPRRPRRFTVMRAEWLGIGGAYARRFVFLQHDYV